MTAATDLSGPLSGEDYMLVLVARQAAFMASRPQSGPLLRFPPLLEWFVRDEDVQHVVLPEPAPTSKRVPTPRVYRSADSIRAELATVTAQLDAFSVNDVPDRAATNLSTQSRHKSAARAGRARFARMDRDLERYVALAKRRDQLTGSLARAEARESRLPTTGGAQ